MDNMDILMKQKYIFTKLFLISNKLHIIGSNPLADEMTISQWFITVTVAQFGNNPPTLSEVSEFMGSSHQNAKQLALKLTEKGFLEIEKDRQDLRAIRLKLTDKCYYFWQCREKEMKAFLNKLFEEFCEEEIGFLYDSLNRLYKSTLTIENKF